MDTDTPAAFARLFIALAVPADVRQEIGHVQTRLRRDTAPGTVRWTPPDQFHVTLKFLGDVPVADLDDLRRALAPVCAAGPALDMAARGIGFFPPARPPRVVWAGAHDAERRLPELQRQIDNALRRFAPADRPGTFTGHVTLGRFKPGGHAGVPRLLASAAPFRDHHFGAWRSGEILLVQSRLTALRAEHTTIAAYPLAVGS
jgi:2'-5' RNA ligase